MKPRDDAWLRHQQRRWMRPDAARWIRPDVARYLKPGTDPAEVFPALRRKYEGQPRLPGGSADGGQFTFGRMGGGSESNSGRPRVYITGRDDDGYGGNGSEGNGGDWGLNDLLDSILPLASTLPGIGHNQGPPLEDPPEIPRSKPSRSSSSILRTAAIWVSRALTLRNLAAVTLFFGTLKAISWAWTKINEIITYLDRPRTMEELQSAVDVPRAGTEMHHWRMEQHVSRLRGMTWKQIDAPGNRVRIPTWKHYDITEWYRQPKPKFGGLSPRQFLADQPAEVHERVGREALILFKVLKP
ncbi:MAG: hypothetical protein ABWY64_25475 [Tardiphaga sp.]